MSANMLAADEKTLLDHAAWSVSQPGHDGRTLHYNGATHGRRGRSSCATRAGRFAALLALLVAGALAAATFGSLAMRMHHCQGQGVASADAVDSVDSVGAANAPVNVVADAGSPGSPSGSFSRLLEAVAPDTDALHRLLHEYFPDMYKHGVYPSEASALAAIHRENAALATSIAQMARRQADLPANTTSSAVPSVSVSVPVSVSTSATVPSSSASSSGPSSSGPSSVLSTEASSTASTLATSTVSSTPAATTSETTSKTASATSSKITTVFTSTIDGTPTVVTATSVVGVAASNTPATTTGSGGGTLQTGAAAPLRMLAGAHLAQAVAGAVAAAVFF